MSLNHTLYYYNSYLIPIWKTVIKPTLYPCFALCNLKKGELLQKSVTVILKLTHSCGNDRLLLIITNLLM